MSAIRLATWNVNSIKVRLPHLLQWLAAQEALKAPIDALCLQELKLTEDKFPFAELEAAGYYSLVAGQKTYNGVAILSKNKLEINKNGFKDPLGQSRFISTDIKYKNKSCRSVIAKK